MIDTKWVGKGINGDNWKSSLEFSSGVRTPEPSPPDRKDSKVVLYVVRGNTTIAMTRARNIGFSGNKLG